MPHRKVQVGIVSKDQSLFVRMAAEGVAPQYTGPFNGQEAANSALQDVVGRLVKRLDEFERTEGGPRAKVVRLQ